MPEVEENAFAMEKTPAYFSFPPYDIPFQIRKHLPKVKLLLVVCDPTKRALSHYKQLVGSDYCVGRFTKKCEKFNIFEATKVLFFRSKYLVSKHTFRAAF